LNVYKIITEVNIAATFISKALLNVGIITVILFVAYYLLTMCVTFVLCGFCTPKIND